MGLFYFSKITAKTLTSERKICRLTLPRSITEKEYAVGGSTALLDAIGRTIHKIGNAQKHTADDYRAEKVMFIISTDGEENSSREYSADRVRAHIEKQKKKYGWEFIFLGANIDAVETAGRMERRDTERL